METQRTRMLTDILTEVHSGQPRAISPSLLWDQDMRTFDWQASKVVVVQRVVERGNAGDFLAAFDLYGGEEGFREVIKQVPYLSDIDINFVCIFFNLRREELLCCTRRQLRAQHLGC